MKFYSDIPATLGIWDGKKMLTFKGGVYETDDPREIELLKNAGYRHDKEAEEKCQEATAQSNTQTNTSQDASTPKDGAKPAMQTKKKLSGRQQKK